MSQPTPETDPTLPPPEPTPIESAPESAPPAHSPQHKTRGIVLRILIWGAVAAAAILAYFELRARNHYSNTVEAWFTAQKEASEAGREFRRSHLEGLIQGTPERTIRDLQPSPVEPARQRGTYTWHGVLDDYTVWVDYGLPADDPVVQLINQPDLEGE